MKKQFTHRYIPNSAPGIKEQMLKEIGLADVEEMYSEISEDLRFRGKLNIPSEPLSELEVVRNVKSILAKNTSNNLISFLGAGCWPHYVPAVCDEINSRSEFLTAYAGNESADLGRLQALFEFQSMVGDLLAMDVVGAPSYDGPTASADALLMSNKITGRTDFLVPRTISPDRLSTIMNYVETWMNLITVEVDPETGLLDLEDLKKKLSAETAAVYIENPTYLGFIEFQCEEISELTHEQNALLVVCSNPASLGVIKAPGEYGADIVCAEGQPLGMHMSYGGATLGIIACRDEEPFLDAIPTFLIGVTDTCVEGEYAFSWHVHWDRIMYAAREKARSFTGTSSALWAITAAVYLSLLGPKGMRQLGEVNMQKTYYAMELLSEIKGIQAPLFNTTHFNEFTVNFDDTGKTVEEVNSSLFKKEIIGGKDLTSEFPDLGNTALFCVTESHSKEEIDLLANTLREVTQ